MQGRLSGLGEMMTFSRKFLLVGVLVLASGCMIKIEQSTGEYEAPSSSRVSDGATAYSPSTIDGEPAPAELRTASSSVGYDPSLLFSFDGPDVLNPGGCYPLTITHVNGGMVPTPATDPALLTASLTGIGALHFDDTCSIAAKKLSVATGQQDLNMFIRAHEVANLSVTVNSDMYTANATQFNTTGRAILNNYVYAVAAMTDGSGRFYLGGNFTGDYNRLLRMNPDGTIDETFDVGSGFNNRIEVILPYDDGTGRLLVGGYFSSYNGVSRRYIVRLNDDGSVDDTFDDTGFSYAVLDLAFTNDGKIYAGGGFSTADSQPSRYLARLNADGTFDDTFDVGGYSSLNSWVTAVGPTNDGGVIVGGYFTSYQGTTQRYLAKFDNAGGLVDNFPPSGAPNSYPLAIETDPADASKVYIGGYFNNINGQNVPYFTKIDADTGANDPGYTPVTTYQTSVFDIDFADDGSGDLMAAGTYQRRFTPTGTQVYVAQASVAYEASSTGRGLGDFVFGGQFTTMNNITLVTGTKSVRYVSLLDGTGNIDTNVGYLADGSLAVARAVISLKDDTSDILLGGDVTDIDGSGLNYLARIQPNGEVDVANSPPVDGQVYGFLPDADKAYIYGYFTTYDGNASARLARIDLTTGAFDGTFAVGTGPNSGVIAADLDSSGNLIIGGAFTTYNGTSPVNRLARVDSTGTLDAQFSLNIGSGPNSTVQTLTISADGKIWVGGNFTTFNGQSSRYIVRLNADGTIDEAFGTKLNSVPYAMAAMPDGDVFVGGQFNYFDGAYNPYLVRLNADGTRDTTFSNSAYAGYGNIRSLRWTDDGLFIGAQKILRRVLLDGTPDPTFNDIETDSHTYATANSYDQSGDLFAAGHFLSYDLQVLDLWNVIRITSDGTLD